MEQEGPIIYALFFVAAGFHVLLLILGDVIFMSMHAKSEASDPIRYPRHAPWRPIVDSEQSLTVFAGPAPLLVVTYSTFLPLGVAAVPWYVTDAPPGVLVSCPLLLAGLVFGTLLAALRRTVWFFDFSGERPELTIFVGGKERHRLRISPDARMVIHDEDVEPDEESGPRYTLCLSLDEVTPRTYRLARSFLTPTPGFPFRREGKRILMRRIAHRCGIEMVEN